MNENIEKQFDDNLKQFNEIVEFIKSLDDEGIEKFIRVAKEELKDIKIGNEDELRETLKKIRDGK